MGQIASLRLARFAVGRYRGFLSGRGMGLLRSPSRRKAAPTGTVQVIIGINYGPGALMHGVSRAGGLYGRSFMSI